MARNDVKGTRVDSLVDEVRDLERRLAETRLKLRGDLAAATETVEFGDAVRGVIGDAELPAGIGRRAALIAVAEIAWTGQLGPSVDGAGARALLGDVSRQRLDQMIKGEDIVVLETSGGRRVFPLFQFGPGGRPMPDLVSAWTAVSASSSPWTAASWCVSEHPDLGDGSPAEWAAKGGDRETLFAVAASQAERLAH